MSSPTTSALYDQFLHTMRFVDYQLSHYGSFAFDLQYFINTSLSFDVLPSTERLLLEYTQTLQEHMKILGLANPPTFHQVLDEMKRVEFFGLFTAVSITPVIIAPPHLAPPKFSQDLPLEEIVTRNVERFRTEEYTRRIQIILRRAIHGGFFERAITS